MILVRKKTANKKKTCERNTDPNKIDKKRKSKNKTNLSNQYFKSSYSI